MILEHGYYRNRAQWRKRDWQRRRAHYLRTGTAPPLQFADAPRTINTTIDWSRINVSNH